MRLIPDWKYQIEAAVYAVMPPGGMVPGKTRVFVDEIAVALKDRA